MLTDPREYESELLMLGAKTVTLVVGEDKQEQIVHERIICKSSAFFAAATKIEWFGGKGRMIPLPDDTPEVVELYVHWLYFHKIMTRPSPLEKIKDCSEMNTLIQLFIFGEKIQDNLFKDTVIDAMILSVNTCDEEGSKWCPIGNSIDVAFKGTPVDSPLRRLLLDIYIQHGHSRWIQEGDNAEFLESLARTLLDSRRDRPKPDPTSAKVSSCQYHHHTKDELCYAADTIGKNE